MTIQGPSTLAPSKLLPLAGPSRPAISSALAVARGEVVEDRVAEDMVARASASGMLARVRRVTIGDLQLVVHHLAVARPAHRRLGAGDDEAVGDVVDRHLPIDLGAAARSAAAIAAWNAASPPFARASSARVPRPDWRICVSNDIASRICRGSGKRREQRDVGERRPVSLVAARRVRAASSRPMSSASISASIEAKGAGFQPTLAAPRRQDRARRPPPRRRARRARRRQRR